MGLSVNYFILALAVCMGVIQITASYSGLRGLLLFPSARLSTALGFAMPAAAFTWFIVIGDVGVPGDLGGVEGAEQFALFFGAAAIATGLTAALASATQQGRLGRPEPERGLAGLSDATLAELLGERLRRHRNR